jgi:hypothetical protein
LIKDGFGRGQSLGKRFAGLMVVQLDNDEPCGFGSSFLRNLAHLFLNVIPGIGFFIEPLVLVLHEKGQRLGDLLSRTQVIDVREYHNLTKRPWGRFYCMLLYLTGGHEWLCRPTDLFNPGSLPQILQGRQLGIKVKFQPQPQLPGLLKHMDANGHVLNR